MRKVMMNLAIIWLAGLGIMMGFRVSRTPASAGVVVLPAEVEVERRQSAPDVYATKRSADQGRALDQAH